MSGKTVFFRTFEALITNPVMPYSELVEAVGSSKNSISSALFYQRITMQELREEAMTHWERL